MAAIKDGSVDLLPEYTGAALAYFKKNATETEDEATYDALKAALPSGLEVLDKSPAADEDTIVVTKATADKYSLKSMADLKPVGKDMVAGGGPEFKIRDAGLKGLKDKYGVEFKEYKTLDAGGPLSLKALKDNQIQVTNFFTTQSVIKDNNLVMLEDPENILPPNNDRSADPDRPQVGRRRVDAERGLGQADHGGADRDGQADRRRQGDARTRWPRTGCRRTRCLESSRTCGRRWPPSAGTPHRGLPPRRLDADRTRRDALVPRPVRHPRPAPSNPTASATSSPGGVRRTHAGVVTGSHLDSVIDGGAFDGPLGVVSALGGGGSVAG